MTDTSFDVPSASRERATWALGLDIRLDETGPVVARERVEADDLDDARSELWREACLRRGLAGVALDGLDVHVDPIESASEAGRYGGYALEIVGGAPEEARGRRCVFTVRSLGHVATRVIRRLVTNGVVRASDLYHYEITARRETAPPGLPGDAPFRMTTSSRPLDPLRRPLASIRSTASTVETGMTPPASPASPFPVLYTAEALARAEAIARRGRHRQPPVETGGVLVGPLGVCPVSGELYAVVTDVVEAECAEEERSLTYSATTWRRVQQVVRAMRTRPGCASYRALGQVHGHNFLPADGAPPCEHCARVAHCTRTSVFVSEADASWSRAVFCRQPWKLCHIFGLNARGESVQGLFGLDDGRLTRRPFEVIGAFDPLEDA